MSLIPSCLTFSIKSFLNVLLLKKIPAMPNSWIVLSATWKLEDVQAGLNVVITLLSASAIIVSARLSWRNGVQRLYQRSSIPVSEIISVSTLGEVHDMMKMLKRHLLSGRYHRVLLQCGVVIFFTVTAILAGPISRYSTRRGQVPRKDSVGGLMASTADSCQWYATAAIDTTIKKLDRASFPTDQLLDFLPDEEQDWVFVPSEWNSTYSTDCVYTELTPINLTTTGNFTYDNGGQTEIMNELPQLWDIFGPEYKANWLSIDWNLDGITNDTARLWTESILFVSATIQPDGPSNLTTSMRIAMVALHLRNAPEANFTDDKSGNFAAGVVPESSYTKVECGIQPSKAAHLSVHQTYEELYWRAFPDVFSEANPSCLSVQMTAYYLNSALKPSSKSANGWDVKLPTGEEMLRFYQAYLIVKDTYYRSPNTRVISVRHLTVDISAVFVTIMSLAAFVIGSGAVLYARFSLRNPLRRGTVPQTKLDWVLQAVQEADLSDPDVCATSQNATAPTNSKEADRARTTSAARFKAATYSAATTSTVFPAKSGKLGKVNSLGIHAPAARLRPGSTDSETSQFKLGLLPFETVLPQGGGAL